MIRFASLGSGSRGNAWVVHSGRTRVLVDCGFGPRELARRLGRLGLEPADIDAVIVTHEHSDHIGGIAAWARLRSAPIFMSAGTRLASGLAATGLADFDSDTPFAVGDLRVEPYPVPHDAREPTQFVFGDGAHRLGLLTDAGFVTPHMVTVLSGCAALVIECNHDADMLRRGPYPWPLKQRIAGRHGHLDNAAAADLLRQVATDRLQYVVAAHLSQENNTPQLARAALAQALGCDAPLIGVADQASGCDWRSLA